MTAPLRLVTPAYEQEVSRMREEDRRVRRGIALGILIGGVLLWPTVVAFAWLVLWWAL